MCICVLLHSAFWDRRFRSQHFILAAINDIRLRNANAERQVFTPCILISFVMIFMSLWFSWLHQFKRISSILRLIFYKLWTCINVHCLCAQLLGTIKHVQVKSSSSTFSEVIFIARSGFPYLPYFSIWQTNASSSYQIHGSRGNSECQGGWDH